VKILGNLTIIPVELYVERKADRQLENNLRELGRPGYVLVARQMGKTNLLLNARRKRKGTSELFTYLDLSNPFPDVRSFFRNIIDLTLESSPHLLQSIEVDILAERAAQHKLPHKEHEWELRRIVSAGVSKLIICLDEIDALARCDYSDQVFSFIRSVYFSGRANFEELNRVTYLLSGVAEPAEIIKNKDISPFNIGEKIYLDDFSLDETKQLLSLAGIELSEQAFLRLYDWIGGYPRMTWDVCSALEDLKNAKEAITSELIDKVVKGLYFSDVDAPPVDHMKKIAEENSEIRSALMSIHYGGGKAVGESTRTRLYLAGITQMVPEGKAVRFKNRVLDEALNVSYLEAASERAEKLSLHSAIDKIAMGQGEQGLVDLRLIESSLSGEERLVATHWKGVALFDSARYAESAAEFRTAATGSTDLSRLSVFYLGIALMRVGDFVEALEPLRVAQQASTSYSLFAAIAYARCLVATGGSSAEAEQICLKVIASPSELLNSKATVGSGAESLASAYIVMAEIYKARRQNEHARTHLEGALQYSTVELQLRIYIALADLSNAGPAKTLWLKKATQLVRDARAILACAEGRSNDVSRELVGELLLRARAANLKDEIAQVVQRAFQGSEYDAPVDETVDELVGMILTRKDVPLGVSVLERAVELSESKLPASNQRSLLGYLIQFETDRGARHWGRYIKTLTADKGPYLHEMCALSYIALSSTATLLPQVLNGAIDLIHKEPIDSSAMGEEERLSLDVLRRVVSSTRALRVSPTARDVSAAKTALLDISRKFSLPGFTSAHIRSMQHELGEALKRLGHKVGPTGGARIGRNEFVEVQFPEGIRVGKYKKFEAEISAGVGTLIRKVSKQ
jgi:hypothetical protein